MKNSQPLLSIIVPVYNTEKFLKKCIDSILAQTFKDFELILVNDGSTDSSGDICDQYACANPNQITVIHKENEGQGIARNIGLDISKGDYISFVDSDDYICANMYEKMFIKEIEDDCDIIVCDVNLFMVAENTTTHQKSINHGEFSISEYIKSGINICSPCNKLFKKEIWNDFRFKKMIFEDAALIPVIISFCKNIGYIKLPLYNYCLRANSTSTSYKRIEMLDMIKAMELSIDNCNPEYKNEMVYAQAQCILFWLTTERKIFISDYIDFLKDRKEEFQKNQLILSDTNTKCILEYIDINTIPQKLYYPNFGRGELQSNQIKCIDSWNKYTRNFEIIQLNEDNCKVYNAPRTVQNAYREKNYSFVNDYFKLKYVFEQGGFAVDSNMLFQSPIGELRINKTFFGFKNFQDISSNMFGSVANAQIIKILLQSYKFCGMSSFKYGKVLTDNDESLSSKINKILTKAFKLAANGETQDLASGIHVCNCNMLGLGILEEEKIAKPYSQENLALENTNFELIDKSILKKLSDNERASEKAKKIVAIDKIKEVTVIHTTKKNLIVHYPFKFSIVMAVYNVEPFIREAIDSLIEQDIGFKDSVQLILVDDGSPDNSGVICDEYAAQYPNNIIVIHKENGGLSSARNEGLKHVQGKYVNFFDPDDKLSLNTLSSVYIFFETHYDDVDLVAIPLVFFDAQTGEHPLNIGKFNKGTRVIDLNKEYKCVHMNVASAFLKLELTSYIKFDEQITTAEDAKEVHKVLLNKPNLGVVHDCIYYYRKRITGEKSIIDTAKQNKKYYLLHMKNFTLFTINNAINKFGKIPPYLQFAIMYDLKWRFYQNDIPENVLTDDEIVEYKRMLREALQFIDDRYIMETDMWYQLKVFILNFKYGKQGEIRKIANDNVQMYHGKTNYGLLSNIYTMIEFITYENGVLIIEGKTMCLNCTEDEDIPVYATINKRNYFCKTVDRDINQYSVGDLMFRGIRFKLEIPISDQTELYQIQFYYIYRNCSVLRKEISFGNFSPIGKKFSNSYFYKDHRVLTFANSTLYFRKCGIKGRIQHEYSFLKELKNTKNKKEAVKFRVLYHLFMLVNKKDIWLVSDKANRADDNGEAFFKYLNKTSNKKLKAYYVISKHSDDYKRIKKIGKTVDFLSFRHKLLFLLAKNNISAYTHVAMSNPLRADLEMYRDLLINCDSIFLQHGIIHNDISLGLNRFNKNYKLFITSAKEEYQSILDYNYNYNQNQVLLSGLPRYDLLHNSQERIITIAPTWRKYLFSKFIENNDSWEIIDNFKESEFYQYYNQLVNSDNLLLAAKKYGYKIHYLPHSVFFPHINMFEVDKRVILHGTEVIYKDMFAKSDLFVTDYSSAVFDFAYLRKPVVYSQFDKEEFFTSHGYMLGYFDYEKDGFGEVEYDLESTINRIIEYMENDCKLKDKYRQRIDDFFAFNDKNNCQRIYDAIIDKDK